MCILFWTVENHPKYKFIFAGNRDEFLRRPTARARFWEEADENILGGIDLEAHPMDNVKNGTWLGINRQGKFAALTNFREQRFKGTVTRGALVRDFLYSRDPVHMAIDYVKSRAEDFGGFSLICFDFGNKNQVEMMYITNRENQLVTELEPEKIYGTKKKYKDSICVLTMTGLSNSILTKPWPKVAQGKELFEKIIKSGNNDPKELTEALFDMLSQPMTDTENVDTIMNNLKERIFIPKFDFPDITGIKEPSYGTRTSTVVLIDYDDNVTFVERDWYDSNLSLCKSGECDERSFRFQIDQVS
ncbi:hypothetical protein CU097_006924 [Rhizopus azygosporus]|uniref:Uncharacterized protein n=1 Tax=Rhizopus azygosporus TaxID=86630 RepID=A0A367JKW1_RHIAZ|nr:hypothetical protein CU097_006924 [Rhizopus azygosporus]